MPILASTRTVLLAVFLQFSDSLPPKPAPPPAEWRGLIGAYLSGHDTVYVYEDHGALFARVDSVSPPPPPPGRSGPGLPPWSPPSPAPPAGARARVPPPPSPP